MQEINSQPNRSLRRELHPVLIFLNGEQPATPTPLERETVTIGRSLEAHVRINDPKVSRLHAQIVTTPNLAGARYFLTDLKSKNGTMLNGEIITEPVLLKSGDEILIGGELLRFDMVNQADRESQKQIYRLLAHDELTGLLSSRSFFSELRREAHKAVIESKKFCVLMLDLDFFTSVNDVYGHVTGSKTLAEASQAIVKVLRAGDVAARFGGEEFAVFLLDAELRHGLVAAERIRTTIEKTQFTVTRQIGKDFPPVHKLTISVGVASFPEDSRDPIELIEMADAALYRAKQTGRNRACAYRQTIDNANEQVTSSPRR